uniref:Uncharacterized protein n=1 Tax=Rhizophora mucronata TaxID=61149 RepID=A0A2P2PRA7_RHIMU
MEKKKKTLDLPLIYKKS